MNASSQPNVALGSFVRQTKNQVSADMGNGETGMLSIESGSYYHLNETASRIWQLIETPCRVDCVCSTLQDEFDVEQDQCEAEVMAHLAKMIEDGMVEVVDAAAA